MASLLRNRIYSVELNEITKPTAMGEEAADYSNTAHTVGNLEVAQKAIEVKNVIELLELKENTSSGTNSGEQEDTIDNASER